MDSPPYKTNPVLGTSKHISDDLFSRHWRGELTSGKKHEQKTHKKELGGLPTNRTALQAAGTGLHWGKLKRNSARSAGKKMCFLLSQNGKPAPRTGACPTNGSLPHEQNCSTDLEPGQNSWKICNFRHWPEWQD